MANYVSKIKPNGEEGPEYKLKDEEARSAIQNTNNNVSGSKSVNCNPIVISDAANAYAEEVIANIEPIQDLHGYDHPWVGGAGKNKFKYHDRMASGVLSGITFTLYSDNTSWRINGTSTDTIIWVLNDNITSAELPSGSYILSRGGISSNVQLYIDKYLGSTRVGQITNMLNVESATLNIDWNGYDKLIFGFFIYSGQTVSNLVQHPMIRLATETDPTFEPYSNICPISGLDSVEVKRTGKNQAYDVTYISTKNQYAPVIKTSYKLKQGKRYVISFYTANTNISIYREAPSVLGFDSLSEYAFDTDGTRKSMYGTATADATISNVDIIKRLSSTSDVESGLCYDLQIEEVADTVTTPTEYEPYIPETHTTSLSQTTYGGTLNVQTGELVVDRGYYKFDGSETWVKFNKGWGTTKLDGIIKSNINNSTIANIISDIYIAITPNGAWNGSEGAGITVTTPSDNAKIRFYDSDLVDSNVSAVASHMSGHSICYELATPQTYNLTPEQVKLLKGYNYITTNADTLDIIYQVNNVLGEILSESEGYTDRVFDDLGTASKKDIETTLTNDENLPTGNAVIDYLNSNFAKCYYNKLYTGDANNLDSYEIALVSCIASSTINLPTTESGDWYNIFSMRFNGNINYVIQIAFRINSSIVRIRFKAGSWNQWTTV